MIYDIKYTPDGYRDEVVMRMSSFGRDKLTVIDIGATYKFWSKPYVTAVMDIFPPQDKNITLFQGNANLPWVWYDVENYVEEHGKFDFCICSHTLEDLANPMLPILMMPRIAKAGFIAIPSKYAELRRNVFKFRGSIHHRWIFNKESNKEGKSIVMYPKVSFVEWENKFDAIANQYRPDNAELQFYWKNDLEISVINDDYLGPSDDAVFGYYDGLLNGEQG